MKVNKKQMRGTAQYLMAGALVAVLLAAWGFLATDIWLASTQWLLVAAVLAVFGLYSRMES